MHGQARVLLYIRIGIRIKKRNTRREDEDLPSIYIEIGLGREKKTCFNFYYQEFTGGVSGLEDFQAQRNRLARQISHWTTLYA